MPLKHHNFYPGDIPESPGCYIYRDIFGTVIYVGKATNLRRRMSQYFQASRAHRADPKLRSLINTIETWEFITVKNEDEALVLETHLIKEYAPRYNILMRDDKRHLMLKLDLTETFPRLKMARLKKDDSCLYFGPFPKGGELRQTADFLVRHLHLRTCKVDNPTCEDRKHCLAGAIRDCCRPCEGKVTAEEYGEKVQRLIQILNGDIHEVIEKLTAEMKSLSAKMQFEKAAVLRNIAENIRALYAAKNRTFEHVVLTPTYPGLPGVKDLQEVLHLANPPKDMECFDISNISGTLAVASCTHFTDGVPNKSLYRKFRIKSVVGPNDFAMLHEAVFRHFTRLMNEQKPFPDLLVIDGGKGQLSAVLEALVAAGCQAFPVISLAEKQEEIFLPGQSEPLVVPRDRPALKLLQSIRDETHRTAITYHRQLRLNTIRDSILDEIEGIGESRKKAILREFGSVVALRKAPDAKTIADRVPGIGPEFAQKIFDYLQSHKPDGKINPL